jgi:hypothetical protein
MKISKLFVLAFLLLTVHASSQFSMNAQNWYIPHLHASNYIMGFAEQDDSRLVDINGDGILDLIDSSDNSTNTVWLNGSQRYWKVYIGNGAGFDTEPIIWDIPNVAATNQEARSVGTDQFDIIDMNGDGFVDMVDAVNNNDVIWGGNSSVYWRVYLGDGTGFDNISLSWELPVIDGGPGTSSIIRATDRALSDMNGDGLLDLIDTQDLNTGIEWVNGDQHYWKVYLNTGTDFSTTAIDWIIPSGLLSEGEHCTFYTYKYAVMDMNGDGLVDIVDGGDGQSVWFDGVHPYWKVYLNTGSGFYTSYQSWIIPYIENDLSDMWMANSYHYELIDMDGDGFTDLVDTQNGNNSLVWIYNGFQFAWKFYKGNGTGFEQTDSYWDIPHLSDIEYENATIESFFYKVVDLNGDGILDVYDCKSNSVDEIWSDESGIFWKVYLGTTVGVEEVDKEISINIFPNPTSDILNIVAQDPLSVQSYLLLDVTGKQIMQGQLQRTQTQLDLSGVPGGVYFLQLNGEKNFVSRVVVGH